ncbi:MAG: 3-hydroxyacyl-CoA dehydrogenase NAD-binding domain-containing protein [Bacteroidota bacterium]
MDITNKKSPVLIIGNGRLSHSVTVCLLQAGHTVTLQTNDVDDALKSINDHCTHLAKENFGESSVQGIDVSLLNLTNVTGDKPVYEFGLALTGENVAEKKAAICQLEKQVVPGAFICINSESISLSVLQEACSFPERLIGLNWTEPAHTTYFLEIIANSRTDKAVIGNLFSLAKNCWKKDPYLISNGIGIRAKMLGVMMREAFYLVQNGYASIEDIDRACRNDAGYYLPFSGNFRYMDLMGTYAYGLVMKDLNRELSTENSVPDFFKDIIEQGGLGMENNKGFYEYEEGDVDKWKAMFGKFSYQIQEIISRYPFSYRDKLFTAEL